MRKMNKRRKKRKKKEKRRKTRSFRAQDDCKGKNDRDKENVNEADLDLSHRAKITRIYGRNSNPYFLNPARSKFVNLNTARQHIE